MNICTKKQTLIIYIILTIVTLAVFWQVHQFEFINLDDDVFVIENHYIKSGITLEGLRWAFCTAYAEYWHPLTWFSLMLDYQLYGLQAGCYHLTNLVLHILSVLLLFRLFYYMTGAFWRSTFVAAFFALHPLHVESVAWIAERKDVLSAFFWMLTLYFYVYYTGKPNFKRYILVILSFVCALMSKPMVVTMPVIMMLLDYWPLGRFESKQNNLMSWQLKEKTPFFVLSVVSSMITVYNQHRLVGEYVQFPLSSRLANAFVSFMTYLLKTFWPHNMAIFYPFPNQIPFGQVLASILLLVGITVFIFVQMKRLPYLFVGWLFYSITLLPVIGIIQSGEQAMADRYTYIPLIGISIMLAWGVPSLIANEETRKKILFPTSITIFTVWAGLAWLQCNYWKNSLTLYGHALQVTKNNYPAHNNLGVALFKQGKIEESMNQFKEALRVKSDYADPYNNLGVALFEQGKVEEYITHFNTAIRLKSDYAVAFNNAGKAYAKKGKNQLAIYCYTKSIGLKNDYAEAYNNRGTIYGETGNYRLAIKDFNKAIKIKPDYADAYYNRAFTYENNGKYQSAIEDYNKVIILRHDSHAYNNRGFIYLKLGNNRLCCDDAQKACELRDCQLLEIARYNGICR